MSLHAVIMAGGSGTRFWPLSRRCEPKQFLRFFGERSLIQLAYDRCQPTISADRFWVVTNEQMAAQTAEHLPSVPAAHILKEPCPRNTAPCIALAAACLLKRDPNAIMLTMPADHIIEPKEDFQSSVEQAVELIVNEPERLVLFGVPPTYPSTGYGYIERGDAEKGTAGIFPVTSFREKPGRETAESYLRDGKYFWNCGIFVFRADRILRAINEHEPEMGKMLEQLMKQFGKSTWDDALNECFPTMKSISIDYAVLEREQNIAVVEAPFEWDDVGNWSALERHNPQDKNGNTIIGEHVGINTSNCIVRSTDGHVIATIGIENCIIVHTEDGTLVANRSDENAVREIVSQLNEDSLERYL